MIADELLARDGAAAGGAGEGGGFVWPTEFRGDKIARKDSYWKLVEP